MVIWGCFCGGEKGTGDVENAESPGNSSCDWRPGDLGIGSKTAMEEGGLSARENENHG